ncbi:multidrug transporter [Thalassotalea sp. HSM 43]|uniref:SapC family protein n=1 Tax=Thalassotalea sp. HSM 43 TaxID=2552945 RepID=UPI0010812280|nr:SapC family protein [Thalassotalea sp. HSM 43]QBY03252.1 multidrug transporter [Thalassotalea sp. HSM 43]
MANHALLNNVEHKDVKVITKRSAQYGDNMWYSMTFPQEFRSAQAYYPIFFTKDPGTGKFICAALFGFAEQENLFLNDDGWHARYIPISVLRHPFLIARQTVEVDGQEQEKRMLTIDMDNPRVNSDEGEELFLEFGGNSEYLDRMASIMEALHFGALDGMKFCERLVELNLIEPFTLDVTLNDQSKHQMLGFYTISEEKLNDLDVSVLQELKEKGYLQAIYMQIASQSNINNLLDKKNAQVAATAV